MRCLKVFSFLGATLIVARLQVEADQSQQSSVVDFAANPAH